MLPKFQFTLTVNQTVKYAVNIYHVYIIYFSRLNDVNLIILKPISYQAQIRSPNTSK